MGLKGDLNTFSLADIFQTLSLSQKEGTLNVVNGERRKTIYFGHGGLRLLQVGQRNTPLLGDLLVRAGTVTQGLLDSALKHQRASGKRLGETLVELGMISQEQIDHVLRTQVEEEVFDLFWWKDAAFEFNEGPPPPELLDTTSPVTSIQLDVNALLFEAARRLDEWARMVKVISDFQEIFVTGARTRGLVENGTIKEPAEIEVLSLADGSRTVLELITAASIGRFETCRVLYQAIGEGKVFPAARDELLAAAEKLRAGGDKDRAARLALRAVDRAPDDLAARRAAASLQIEVGDLRGAISHLRKASDLADQSGNPSLSVQLLEQAQKCDPNSIEVQMALFQRYAALQHKDRAGRIVMPLIHGLVAARRFVEASELYQEAQAYVSDPLDLHILQAQALLELQNRSGAVEALGNALHGGTNTQKVRAEQILARMQTLVPAAVELHSLVKEARPTHRPSGPGSRKTAMAAGGVILLVVVVIAVVLTRSPGTGQGGVANQQPTLTDEERRRLAEEERLRQEALAREKLEREEQERQAKLEREREERERLERERREREEQEAQEKIAREAAARRELAAMQTRFRDATAMIAKGPDWDAALKALEEVDAWAAPLPAQQDLLIQVRAQRDKLRALMAEAVDLAEAVRRALDAGNLLECHRLVHRLWKDYAYSASARSTTLPIRVLTYPPGAAVRLGKLEIGHSPTVLNLPYQSAAATVWVEAPGFLPAKTDVSAASPPELVLHLEKVIAWRFRSGGPIEARPVIHGERVYVAGRDGHVSALSLAKGEVLWTFAADTAGDILSSPVIHGDSLYFGSNDHRLYRVGLEDGKEKWHYEADLFLQGSPLVLDDPALVVIGGHDKKLHAVKRETGERVWVAAGSAVISSRPFLYGGNIVVAAEDGKLRAVDPAKGRQQWEFDCGGEVTATPVVADDRAWLGTKSGKLLCVDLKNRALLWSVDLPGAVTSSPVLNGTSVYVTTSTGAVLSCKRDDGAREWLFQAEGAVNGGVAIAEDRVAFGSRDQNIYMLESRTGTLYWKVKTRGAVNGTPLFQGGALLIGADDGQLYCIGWK